MKNYFTCKSQIIYSLYSADPISSTEIQRLLCPETGFQTNENHFLHQTDKMFISVVKHFNMGPCGY